MPQLSHSLDDATQITEYRAVSRAAVASLVLGLLSPLTLVSMLLWIVPALGVALALFALRAISASAGDLTGQKTAWLGLALSTMFATAAPAKIFYTSHVLVDQARPIANAWFQFLQEGEPQKALQLTMPALQRRELDERLWDYYSSSHENREQLEGFVASPVPRLVLEYGKKCQARYYDTIRVTHADAADYVELAYAVIYPEGVSKKTLLVAMTIERRQLPEGKIGWRITSNKGGYRPEE